MQQHTTTKARTKLSSRLGVRVGVGILYVVLTIVLGLGIGGAFTSPSTESVADGASHSNDSATEARHQVPDGPTGTPATEAETSQPPAPPSKKPAAGEPDSVASPGTAAPPGGTLQPPAAAGAPDAVTAPPSSPDGAPPSSPPSDGASAPAGGMAPPVGPPAAGSDTAGPPAGSPGNGAGTPPAGSGTPGEQPGDDAPPADTGESSVTAPIAGDDAVTLDEDTTATVNVLSNDEGQFDSLSISSAPANGATRVEADTVIYEPDEDFNGSDTFTYEVCNDAGCSTGTVTVNVNPVNDTPTVLDIAESTISRGASYSGCVLQVVHDVDGDELSIESVGTPSPSGSAEIMSSEVCGQVITYHHPGGLAGLVVIPFTATDGHGGTVAGEWHVTVVNDAPVVTDESYELDLSVSLSWCLPVLSNDWDPNGDALTLVTVSAYEGTAVESGTCPEGQIHYTAFSDPFLPPFDTIEYSVTDGYSGGATGVVQITLING